MERVVVIGCPGGGKSTFARALAEKTGLPLYYLDTMYWNADKTTVEREVFLARLAEALEKDSWIIDGNYISTMEMRLEKCDTVFFLDFPTELCLDGVRQRLGKPRCDIPWIETEEDVEFMEYIKDFAQNQRPEIIALLKKHSDKSIIVFHDREESDSFLNRVD